MPNDLPSAALKSRSDKPQIVVAMDFDSAQACLKLAQSLDPKFCRLKVGKELFTACGPMIVERLQALGFEVFLDLKFHDIPATTAKAVRAAASLGVWMVNVHASGGPQMLEAAAEALANTQNRPWLIAVTVLTSMSAAELAASGCSKNLNEQVRFLASMAMNHGLDGVVCSALEAGALKQSVSPKLVTVTPGIRPEWAASNDQSRIMSPEQAVANGADYLVIGRPITQADKPAAACERIVQSLEAKH